VDSEELQGRTNIGRQAREIIDEGTSWIEFANELDVSLYREEDRYEEWSCSAPFKPMFLSYLYATVEKIPPSTFPDHFADNPELARTFGFDLEDLPSRSTFKPSRLVSRFADLEQTVTIASKEIRHIAAERGAPIGGPLTQADATDEDSEPSKRTLDRMLRRNGRRVLREVEQTIFPSVSLPRPDDAIYESEELLTLEAISTINNNGVSQGGEQLGDLKNPDPDQNDPFYEDGPTGETLLEALKQMSVDEIAKEINFALRKTYTRARPKLEELDNFDTDVVIALDITYAAYWGEEEGLEWLQGAPDQKEYEMCFKFATAAIVGQHSHYTVAVLPLGSVENADNDAYPGNKEQSYYIGDITRKLLTIANEYVNIRMVFADREFHAGDAVRAIEAEDLRYIIPARRDDRITRKCDRFDELKRGYNDETRDQALYVEHDYGFYGDVKHQSGKSRVTTNLVILPPEDTDDTHGRDEPQPFITNIESVDDELSLDRRWTKKQIKRYQNRAAIENTYTSIKECAAKTSSKAFEVRWFHFGFACIIYNLWLLVDFLTQERINVIDTRKQPKIKLSRFLRWVERETTILI
jgi:hypothetical protein